VNLVRDPLLFDSGLGAVWHAFWHPLSEGGSILYGGIGSDLGEVTLIAAVVVAYRHHNCYVPRCPRLGHIDPEHGHPACKRHHSLRDKLTVQ